MHLYSRICIVNHHPSICAIAYDDQTQLFKTTKALWLCAKIGNIIYQMELAKLCGKVGVVIAW